MTIWSYIKLHWQGKCSLNQAFWLNLVLLFFVLSQIERFIFPPYLQNEIAVTTTVIIYILVVKFVIYPWQVIGILRICDARTRSKMGHLITTLIQIGLVASLSVTLIMFINTFQSLQSFKQDLLAKQAIPPALQYSLDLIRQNTLIHLQGGFQIGITQKVADLLGEYPQITGIILDSDGGQIYEGRGLARLILEYKLQTFTLDKCLSACTTAFVSGSKRTLGKDAKLGFHQYKSYSSYPPVNIEKEQAKDLAIFIRQGVTAGFLEKIFSYPPESMWWPDTSELISAGVVHQVEFSFDDQVIPLLRGEAT